MNTMEDLQKKLEQAEQAVKEVREEMARRERERETEGVWEPELNEYYWFVGMSGTVLRDINCGTAYDKKTIASGSAYRTEKDAEMAALRQKSMKKTMPMPKNKEDYFYVRNTDGFYRVGEQGWANDTTDLDLYNQGRTFRTEEEGQAWIDEFGPAWTWKGEA